MKKEISSTVRTSLAGTYQRRQGAQAMYSYAGAYGVNSEGTWWLVTVRRDGKLKGTPTGMMGDDGCLPSKKQITKLIEFQIEGLHQVAE
jgi:hypothetical protein